MQRGQPRPVEVRRGCPLHGGFKMTKVGHTTKKFYKETRGMKVSGGQTVKAGTVLTREGHRWKPGQNVIGLMHLTAGCDVEV